MPLPRVCNSFVECGKAGMSFATVMSMQIGNPCLLQNRRDAGLGQIRHGTLFAITCTVDCIHMKGGRPEVVRI